jgi:hypothetical protein
MNDDLFDWLVPVNYPPGHMGTFLMGFLSPKIDDLFQIKIIKKSNHEWEFPDILDSFFGTNPRIRYKDLLYKLSHLYHKPEIFQVAAYIILNVKCYLKFNKKSDPAFVDKHMPLLLELADDKKYHTLQYPIEMIKTQTSPYIKEHRDNALTAIKWKQKQIVCEFFDNKAWIPYYLMKFKITGAPYLKINLDVYNDYTSDSFIARSKLDNLFDYTQPHIKVDMYDLVFNKNIEQVYKVDPNFEYTKEKEEMLNLANSTSLEILEYYGIDYNSNIDEKTTIQEVLDMQTKHQTLM